MGKVIPLVIKLDDYSMLSEVCCMCRHWDSDSATPRCKAFGRIPHEIWEGPATTFPAEAPEARWTALTTRFLPPQARNK